ncbi:MAG TPA: glycosyltransferase family 2 protein [Acidimicrobiales bacterium]|nr:glycosyltransferase family 2 protein [Acidimicrobiales bacterium]
MTVTVVVCAYTRERWGALQDAVASLRSQTRVPDEVLVVIDHNDELLELATKGLTGVTVLANRSTKGLSGARNTGVASSHGDVIAFLDDDASADEGWLAAMLVPFDDDAVAGVGGWILPRWESEPALWFPETYYWILGCSYAGLPETGATLRNPIGASMALRRRVFDEVGGFTSGIGRIGKVPLGCEETELCIRYTARHPDHRFVLTHDAVVHHLVPASRLDWHYFRSRCWAEGLSKAAVSSLVGAGAGLASERRHVLRALPRELASSLVSLPRHPRRAVTKIWLIVVGTALATAGLLRGRLAVRRSPIRPGGDELELLTEHREAGDTYRPAAQTAG